MPPPPEPKPRAKSRQQIAHEDFLEQRRNHLAIALDVAPENVPPDDEAAVLWVNVAIGAMFARAEAEGRDGPECVQELVERYLAEPKPATYEPPYPFSALASAKWWEPLWLDAFSPEPDDAGAEVSP